MVSPTPKRMMWRVTVEGSTMLFLLLTCCFYSPRWVSKLLFSPLFYGGKTAILFVPSSSIPALIILEAEP